MRAEEEQRLLDKLMNKHGSGFPFPKTVSERFRSMVRNIDKRPFEHVWDSEEEDEE